MRIHLFNPENDLALAAGTASFTPTAAVRRFKEALAQLPRWYADEGDLILTLGMKISAPADAKPAPWGWSANAAFQFKKAGVDGPFPDIEIIRRLSHRRTALNLYRELRDKGSLPYPLPPEPKEITDVNDLTSTDIMLKSPWSCSGRGVVDCSKMTLENVRKIAAGVIRRQGSVMAEPRLAKRKDFALLFETSGGDTIFKGVSSFFTAATATAYGGNLCAPQDELRQGLDAPYLNETIEAVRSALTRLIAPRYDGPLGVDMITYGPDNLICPTIEVNLRRTMGFVALALFERLGRGVFRIAPGPSADGLQLIDPNPYFSATFKAL